jgi:hypothetical protein
MKQAQLHDGRIITFAPETPDEVIAEHARLASEHAQLLSEEEVLPDAPVTADSQAEAVDLLIEALSGLPSAELQTTAAKLLCDTIEDAAKQIADINAESLGPEDIEPLVEGLNAAVKSLNNLAELVRVGSQEIVSALLASRTQLVTRDSDSLIIRVDTQVKKES